MTTRAISLPPEGSGYEDEPIRFPRGEMWVYSDRFTGSPNGLQRFKVYAPAPFPWSTFLKVNGIEQCAVYTSRKGETIAKDFIIQSFAVGEVQKLLSTEPELFDTRK